VPDVEGRLPSMWKLRVRIKKMKRTRILQGLVSGIGVWVVALAVLLQAPMVHAAAGNGSLKLYEVAGAGGLAGASYRQDTIILFNPTASTYNCSTCAIQLHSGTSNTSAWTVYKLPTLAIPAGGYYMISASSPTLSTSGALAPIAYDYRLKTIEGTIVDGTSGDNILSSTVQAIALTNTQTALTASSASQCGTGSQLLDFLGYGSDIATNSTTTASPATCYAGAGEAYYDGSSQYGRQLGALRKNPCIDAFNNATDWANAPLVFLNSSSTKTPCSTGTPLSAVVTATPTNPGVSESVTVTAAVTKATSPASSGIVAKLNFDSVYYGGTALQMYDDGTHGDATANDGTYTVTTTIPSTAASGFTYSTNVTVTDAVGNSYIGSTRLTIAIGTISMTTPSTTADVTAGGVLKFPITLTGQHGYGGILNITCTGTPNANSLGVPISTQCVSTPPEVTITSNGTATISLAIATGTTSMAGIGPSMKTPLCLAGIAGLGLLAFGVRKGRLVPVLLSVLAVFLVLQTTGCGTNAGLGNTAAAPGTYVYTVTATDSNLSTVTNSLNFTITVK